jgi:hypothetical protein
MWWYSKVYLPIGEIGDPSAPVARHPANNISHSAFEKIAISQFEQLSNAPQFVGSFESSAKIIRLLSAKDTFEKFP